ncbi:MAG: hypothetical protein WC797_03730 [Candidatus Paceibacterota bacterium]|jgi:hypothetical protein
MAKENLYNELIQEEKELLQTLEQVRALIKRYKPLNVNPDGVEGKVDATPNVIAGKALNRENLFGELVSGFNKSDSIPNKVYFVLSLLGTATSKEVGIKLSELDADFSRTKAIADARYWLSDLKMKGRVEVVEQGSGKKGSVYRSKKIILP